MDLMQLSLNINVFELEFEFPLIFLLFFLMKVWCSIQQSFCKRSPALITLSTKHKRDMEENKGTANSFRCKHVIDT